MPDPLINRRLGKYLIQQEIGRGGMARVYRATDTVLQRTVALKILAPQIGNDPELAKRFDREAITAANLRHPSIITIFDVGEADGLRYIAMEYVAGRSLAEVIMERGKLGLPLAIGVLQPVAEALQYAHAQGAVHRDVKPQNIMIDTDGRVLLTDFGIALGPSQQSQKLTQAGLFMGTPEYISPEQAQGQGINGLSDLYSLGVVAYEALAGQVPFSGGVPQLIMAHVYTPPPPITSVNPQLPHELDQVFARVLAKTPGQRLEKTTSLVEALRLVAHHYGLLPASQVDVAALAVAQSSSAGQSTISLATSTAASCTTPSADQIAAVFGPAPVSSEAPVPPAEPRPASPPYRPTPTARAYPQTDEEAFVPRRRPRPAAASRPIPWPGILAVLFALLLVGIVISRSNSAPRVATGLTTAAPLHTLFSPATPSATSTMMTGIPVIAGNPTLVPTTLPGSPTGVPAESAVALATARATVPAVTQTAPAQQVPPPATPSTTSPPATAIPPSATPVSTMTSVPPTNTVPLPSATPTSPTATQTPSPAPPAASPTATIPTGGPTPTGGASHLITQSGKALLLFDVTANKTRTVAANASSIGPAAISPDGQTIVFDALQQGKRRILRYDIATGKTRLLIRADGQEELYHPAWSPDGSRIVFVSNASGNPNLYALDVQGSGGVQRLTDGAANDDYPSFSPDGTQIVFESNRDSGKYALFLLDAAGPHRFSPSDQPFDDRYPRFAPDGTTLLFTSTRDRSDGGSEIYVQPLLGGTPRRLTTFATGSASGPAWSPDGQLVAFFGNGSGNNHIYVVPVAGGTPTDLSANAAADQRWPVWGK